MHYVYILFCSDKKTYVGCTNDLRDRLNRHKKGNIHATQERLPVTLVNYFAFAKKHLAYDFEKYLKSGSGRAFMKRHLTNSA